MAGWLPGWVGVGVQRAGGGRARHCVRARLPAAPTTRQPAPRPAAHPAAHSRTRLLCPRPALPRSQRSNDGVLALKDPSRPFPTGAPLGVLKWRLQTRDEAVLPLSINCWPSISGGESYVNIE